MKRINYAGPARTKLIASDHKTIKMSIKIARNLKKARAPYIQYDLSQLGLEAVPTETGGKEMKPTAKTRAFLDKADDIFQNTDIGPFQYPAQETDNMYKAAVAALNEATKVSKTCTMHG